MNACSPRNASAGTGFGYDRGALEIMSISHKHEITNRINRLLS